MVVNKENVNKYVNKTAHEIAKRQKGPKIAESDPAVEEIKADVIACISGGGPNVKVVVSGVPSRNGQARVVSLILNGEQL